MTRMSKEIKTVDVDNMENLVKFVKWMDEELAFLVDEVEVLKHFPEFPTKKCDCLREATSEYLYLKVGRIDVESSLLIAEREMMAEE